MLTLPARRLTALTAMLALAFALLPTVSAAAAPVPIWKAGTCFTGAEIQGDLVVLSSAVSCDKPHTVQTIGGAPLSAMFADFTLTQLRDQTNKSLRAALAEFGDMTCSGKATAAGIWPRQGAAISSALTGLAATTGGGVLPGYNKGMNFGWVFPDTAAFNAGDRSMVCVIYAADAKLGPSVATQNGMQGDLRQLGTNATLPAMRDCSKLDATGKKNVTIPCSKPHVDELIAHYVAKLPADVASMTDAQWVPYDAQCQALMDVLVGAKRRDLSVVANPPTEAKADTVIYVPCFVSRAKLADGKRPNLPAGTVIGLGTKALKAA
jgi:hypothetical protein